MMLNHVRIAFIPMSVSGVSRYGCHAIIVSDYEKRGKGFMMTETMTDYDGLSMLMHTGADMLMFELNGERNPFRILCILLLIAGFKLTGMLINENMNVNHVNIIRNALIKLSESCQRLVNRANTTIPVPVMSVIAA